MNIIKSLKHRMLNDRGNNKTFPCKVYKSEESAEKAIDQAAKNIIKYFFNDPEKTRPAMYVVFYIEEWNRWVGAVCLTEVMGRKDFTGGYLGIEQDFYKF